MGIFVVVRSVCVSFLLYPGHYRGFVREAWRCMRICTFGGCLICDAALVTKI